MYYSFADYIQTSSIIHQTYHIMSSIGDAIQEKCLAFGDRIIKLNDYLLEQACKKEDERCNKVDVKGKKVIKTRIPIMLKSIANLSNQLLRAGTSIGANNAEASSAISKADFKSKSYIALKEAREVTEQRVESQACLSYPESRRNSTKSKPLLDRFAT